MPPIQTYKEKEIYTALFVLKKLRLALYWHKGQNGAFINNYVTHI